MDTGWHSQCGKRDITIKGTSLFLLRFLNWKGATDVSNMINGIDWLIELEWCSYFNSGYKGCRHVIINHNTRKVTVMRISVVVQS